MAKRRAVPITREQHFGGVNQRRRRQKNTMQLTALGVAAAGGYGAVRAGRSVKRRVKARRRRDSKGKFT